MITIEFMKQKDIDEVLKLEKVCFGLGWTPTPFERELGRDDCAYFVAKENNKIVGYSGYWLLLEELHVTIMGVNPECRRKKIGQILLIKLLREGIKNGAKWSTLEVKATNNSAIKLYQKFGFSVMGRRKHYYQQDGEDALIMWTDELINAPYQELLSSIEEEVSDIWKE